MFVVALFLASFSATLINDLCGLSAFWFTRVAGVSYLVQIGTTLVGGRLVPLELLPHWADTLSFVLPFRWAFGFPIEVIIGPISDGIGPSATLWGSGMGIVLISALLISVPSVRSLRATPNPAIEAQPTLGPPH